MTMNTTFVYFHFLSPPLRHAAQFPPSSSRRRLHYVEVYYFNRFILFSYFYSYSFFLQYIQEALNVRMLFIFFIIFMAFIFASTKNIFYNKFFFHRRSSVCT